MNTPKNSVVRNAIVIEEIPNMNVITSMTSNNSGMKSNIDIYVVVNIISFTVSK